MNISEINNIVDRAFWDEPSKRDAVKKVIKNAESLEKRFEKLLKRIAVLESSTIGLMT